MNLERYLQDCSELRAAGAGRFWLCRLLRPTLGKKLGLAFAAVVALVAAQHVLIDRFFTAGRGIAAQVDAIGSLRWRSQHLLVSVFERRPDAARRHLSEMAAVIERLDGGGILDGVRLPPLAGPGRERLPELAAARAGLEESLRRYEAGWEGFGELREAAGRLLGQADALNGELARRRQALEEAERSRLWLTTLLVAAVLAALLVFVRRRVVRPLRALAAAGRAFAAGRHERRSGFRSFDEIGQMALAFDTMADTIERDLRQLAADAAELETRQLALRKMALAVECAPVSVLITDLRGRIEYVNPRFCEQSGYAAEELLGRSPNLLKSGLTPPATYASLWETIAAGREWRGELINRKKDGSLYREDNRIAPLRDAHGRISHYVAVCEDVTARRQAEEEVRRLNEELERRVEERTRRLAESNRELEAFSYSVSHDLRAPLRGINGFASLMAENCKDCAKTESLEFLARIRRASERMGNLIDDILDLSRLTRHEIRIATVDLSAMARGIVEALAGAEPARQVAVDVQEGLTARGDATLLQAALENLIGNAWKFTARRAQARIGFGRLAGEGGEPVYFVRDNGAGFDMKYAGKLFGAFQRLHAPGEFEGSGIGLAMVRRIVALHGGRIWAEAAPDEGATFYFTLGEGGGAGHD